MTTKVLIVDDEVPLLKNLKNYLETVVGGFEVLTVPTAEAALEILENGSPVDVLLTDVRLPGMDGIELVRSLKARHPQLPIVVMSAFGGRMVGRTAKAEGALEFLEKPLDLGLLETTLTEAAAAASGWRATVGGLDLFDVTQLLAMSGRTLAVEVTFGDHRGLLKFDKSRLVHASSGSLAGEEAFYEMARWKGGSFEELPPATAATLPPNIRTGLSQLMMEAARRRDEVFAGFDPEAGESGGFPQFLEPRTPGGGDSTTVPVTPKPPEREVRVMAIKDHIKEFTGIEGYMAVAILNSNGEILESDSVGKYDIKGAAMYANNVLLNAQKATDQMGAGRGNLVQVRAPKAHVLMRCFNEATDFAATKAGKAHFHVVVVMDPEGNVGMANMILDKVAEHIAEELR